MKVHERDGEIVQVKGRLNSQVNQEWLCDEGRYGFSRFLPEKRLISPLVGEKVVSMEDALKAAEGFSGNQTLVFLSPDLTLEEYLTAKLYLEKVVKKYKAVVAYRQRTLTDIEKILVSPDYACNFQGAIFAGISAENLEAEYDAALAELRAGTVERVLCIGERSILAADCTAQVFHGLAQAKLSLGILTEADSGLVSSLKVVLPGRSILEKSGILINRKGRIQYAQAALKAPEGSHPEWRLLMLLAARHRVNLVSGLAQHSQVGDREVTNEFLKSDKRFGGLTIRRIKDGGISLTEVIALLQSENPPARSGQPAGAP